MVFVVKYRYVTPVTPLLAVLYILVNPVTAPANITETAYYKAALTAHQGDVARFRDPISKAGARLISPGYVTVRRGHD